MIDFASILHPGISDLVYHADSTSLSSSGARAVLRNPARFHWGLTHEREPKAAYDFGHLVHRLVLGQGATIAVIDAPDWRSKTAREERDAARAAGSVPVLQADFDAASACLVSVMGHETAGALFAEGVPELSGYWRDEPTDVQLRFRPDWMTEVDRVVCVDLKTTGSADPNEFARSAAKYGYHQQAAWYLDGLAAHGIDGAQFLLVAVEKTPPYLVSVIELDDTALAEGRRLNREAIDLYARCMETDTWPAYGDDIHLITLPDWALPELEITF